MKRCSISVFKEKTSLVCSTCCLLAVLWEVVSVSTFCFSSLVQTDSRCVGQLLVSGSLCTAGRLLSINWGTSRFERNVRELQKSLKTHFADFFSFFFFWAISDVAFHFRCHNAELEEVLARFCFPSSRHPTKHWSKIFNYWHERKY